MTLASTPPHVAVIGGGWAGCAAALTLAEAGIPTTLYESSRTLGGRARAVELEGQSLDNGQHILLGAYEQTLQLIESLRADTQPPGTWRLPLALNQPPEFQLACPRLPAPLHLLAGLLGAHGLTWREKWAAARWANTLLREATPIDRQTVSQFTCKQPDKLNRLLWHPLCISALNTPPDIASAAVFREVIRAAFGGRTHHSDLLLPRRDLTALLPAPAAARIVELGGAVRLASRVTSIQASSNRIRLWARDDEMHFSHAIIAVAPQHLAALAAQVPELESIAHQVSQYEYQPIATGYIQYDSGFQLDQPLFALGNGPAQFVFDRGQSHGQAGLMAFVASAAEHLPDNWLDQAEAQLRQFAPSGTALWRRSIVEKQATYACIPGMTRPDVNTSHPRLFLAGDYTAGPYPATLESATQSGVQSAGALLQTL